jgi:acetolactate synthase-1/2/3 large subunit
MSDRPPENRANGAEALVRLLRLHDVDTVFGLCGDTSLPFYDALYRLGAGLTHVLARDERSAAYMADAYARVTGRVGVCEGPSGGGATYILPGIVEANESSVPVLAITTDIAVSSRGRFTLTELDQRNLFRPLTKWNGVVDKASQLPAMVRAAFRHMTAGRPGAAHLGVPFDVQRDAVDDADIWADSRYGRYPALRVGPDPEAIRAAAERLLRARRPLIVAGGGVVISGAMHALKALADAMDCPVATTISGQGSISELDPLSVGVVGSNGGTEETRSIVEASDLVFFIGCRAGSVTTERWRYPKLGTPVLHLDIDPSVPGTIYPTEVPLIGDARLGLEALAAAVAAFGNRIGNGDARSRVESARQVKFAAFQALAVSSERPIRPERIVAEFEALLPADAVVIADPGTPCPYVSAYFRFRTPGRHFISNRAHGALGYGLAAVVGAQIGRPQAKCVAIMGDGGFAFAAGELETIMRLRLPVILVIIANGTFGWIKAGQKSGYRARYYSVDFSDTEHAKVAAAYGLKSVRVENPDDLRPAIAGALDSAGPCLIEIVAQPLHEARAPVSEWVA